MVTCEPQPAEAAPNLAVYGALLYDIARVVRNLAIRFHGDEFPARGYIFGGAARDFLARLPPHDVDIAVSFAGPEDLQKVVVARLRDSLLRRVRDVRGVEVATPPIVGRGRYQHFALWLTHRGLSRSLKIDVVFNPRPDLDLDVNSMILEADERRGTLCAAPNPALEELGVSFEELPRLCADQQFHIFRAESLGDDWASNVIRARMRGMEERGWVCLNTPES
jgi:predicted nucleotidyltransferase